MTLTLLAVDPGIRGCGVAQFDGAELVGAMYVKSSAKTGNTAAAAREMASEVTSIWPAVDLLVLEWPRVYASRIREGSTKADPNDLLALAAVDAAIAMRIGRAVTCYFPSDWKGQCPKEAIAARVISRLEAGELAVMERAARAAGSLAHNVRDAVGIGLHHLGRLGVRRAA